MHAVGQWLGSGRSVCLCVSVCDSARVCVSMNIIQIDI